MAPEPDDIDEALAEQLDHYLSALQANDLKRCQELLTEHPLLADYAEAFELLDRMSPDIGFANTVADSLLLHDSPKDFEPSQEQTLVLNS